MTDYYFMLKRSISLLLIPNLIVDMVCGSVLSGNATTYHVPTYHTASFSFESQALSHPFYRSSETSLNRRDGADYEDIYGRTALAAPVLEEFKGGAVLIQVPQETAARNRLITQRHTHPLDSETTKTEVEAPASPESIYDFFKPQEDVWMPILSRLEDFKTDHLIYGYAISGSFSRGKFDPYKNHDLDIALLPRRLYPDPAVVDFINKTNKDTSLRGFGVHLTLQAFGPCYHVNRSHPDLWSLEPASPFLRGSKILESILDAHQYHGERLILITGEAIDSAYLQHLYRAVLHSSPINEEEIRGVLTPVSHATTEPPGVLGLSVPADRMPWYAEIALLLGDLKPSEKAWSRIGRIFQEHPEALPEDEDQEIFQGYLHRRERKLLLDYMLDRVVPIQERPFWRPLIVLAAKDKDFSCKTFLKENKVLIEEHAEHYALAHQRPVIRRPDGSLYLYETKPSWRKRKAGLSKKRKRFLKSLFKQALKASLGTLEMISEGRNVVALEQINMLLAAALNQEKSRDMEEQRRHMKALNQWRQLLQEFREQAERDQNTGLVGMIDCLSESARHETEDLLNWIARYGMAMADVVAEHGQNNLHPKTDIIGMGIEDSSSYSDSQYIYVTYGQAVQLDAQRKEILEATLQVCLAVAGWNTQTHERHLAHFHPSSSFSTRLIDQDGKTIEAFQTDKENYIGNLLEGLQGPNWRVAIIASEASRHPSDIYIHDLQAALQERGISSNNIHIDEGLREETTKKFVNFYSDGRLRLSDELWHVRFISLREDPLQAVHNETGKVHTVSTAAVFPSRIEGRIEELFSLIIQTILEATIRYREKSLTKAQYNKKIQEIRLTDLPKFLTHSDVMEAYGLDSTNIAEQGPRVAHLYHEIFSAVVYTLLFRCEPLGLIKKGMVLGLRAANDVYRYIYEERFPESLEMREPSVHRPILPPPENLPDGQISQHVFLPIFWYQLIDLVLEKQPPLGHQERRQILSTDLSLDPRNAMQNLLISGLANLWIIAHAENTTDSTQATLYVLNHAAAYVQGYTLRSTRTLGGAQSAVYFPKAVGFAEEGLHPAYEPTVVMDDAFLRALIKARNILGSLLLINDIAIPPGFNGTYAQLADAICGQLLIERLLHELAHEPILKTGPWWKRVSEQQLEEARVMHLEYRMHAGTGILFKDSLQVALDLLKRQYPDAYHAITAPIRFGTYRDATPDNITGRIQNLAQSIYIGVQPHGLPMLDKFSSRLLPLRIAA